VCSVSGSQRRLAADTRLLTVAARHIHAAIAVAPPSGGANTAADKIATGAGSANGHEGGGPNAAAASPTISGGGGGSAVVAAGAAGATSVIAAAADAGANPANDTAVAAWYQRVAVAALHGIEALCVENPPALRLAVQAGLPEYLLAVGSDPSAGAALRHAALDTIALLTQHAQTAAAVAVAVPDGSGERLAAAAAGAEFDVAVRIALGILLSRAEDAARATATGAVLLPTVDEVLGQIIALRPVHGMSLWAPMPAADAEGGAAVSAPGEHSPGAALDTTGIGQQSQFGSAPAVGSNRNAEYSDAFAPPSGRVLPPSGRRGAAGAQQATPRPLAAAVAMALTPQAAGGASAVRPLDFAAAHVRIAGIERHQAISQLLQVLESGRLVA
jgi:hypothetical protein